MSQDSGVPLRCHWNVSGGGVGGEDVSSGGGIFRRSNLALEENETHANREGP
jgi:hypothetical protein